MAIAPGKWVLSSGHGLGMAILPSRSNGVSAMALVKGNIPVSWAAPKKGWVKWLWSNVFSLEASGLQELGQLVGTSCSHLHDQTTNTLTFQTQNLHLNQTAEIQLSC